jgi:hypothetical protein
MRTKIHVIKFADDFIITGRSKTFLRMFTPSYGPNLWILISYGLFSIELCSHYFL